MSNNNKISQEDIKKITSMSKSEIEQKLKTIFGDSKNNGVKKMLSGIDVDSIKNKLKSSSKEELEGLIKVISKLDPGLINKIKDSLK